MCTIWDSKVSAPTRCASMTGPPVPFTVAPMTLIAGIFLDRYRLAGDHGLIDAAVTFPHDPIHRHFFAGADPQPVTEMNLIQRHIFVAAVVVDLAGGFGAKPNKALMAAPVRWRAAPSPDPAGPGSRSPRRLQNTPPPSPWASRNEAGKCPKQDGDDAVDIRHPTPKPIRVNMLRLRLIRDCQPRSKTASRPIAPPAWPTSVPASPWRGASPTRRRRRPV